MNKRFALYLFIISCGILCTHFTLDAKASTKKTSKTTKKRRATLSDMSFEELQEAKNKRLAKKDKEGAIRYLEKMMSTCKDKEQLATVLMELADLFFDTGKLAQAEKLYTQFYTLYPGSESIEKAHYKAILCSYYLTLDSDRDQSKTQETLTLASSFLDRKDIFKTYAQDVSSIQKKCYEKLCQSELETTEFYLKRGKAKDLVAAQKRLDSIRKEYVEKMPSLEPYVLALEIEHAVKTKDFTLADQRRTVLAQRFPDAATTKLAANTNHKSFIDRF